MSVSPLDAAHDAIAHTRRQLFPFRFGTWLVLGVLAFLDQCGRSGWNTGVNWTLGHKGDRGGAPDTSRFAEGLAAAVESALAWLSEHLFLVVAGSLAGFLVLAGVLAVVLWINARGSFMYLDAVASGRAELARPWREHARAADSYFAWRLGLALTALAIVAMAALLVGVMVVTLVRGRPEWWSGGALALALLPVLLVLLVALPALALADVALRDFVAPLQLAAGSSCGQAIAVFEGLLLAHTGAFLVYLLLKIVLVVITGIVIVVGGCLTCCLAFLPIVCQTVFQPLFFFERAWSLFLLRQMGYDVPARLTTATP
jgi:hypothetical protein